MAGADSAAQQVHSCRVEVLSTDISHMLQHEATPTDSGHTHCHVTGKRKDTESGRGVQPCSGMRQCSLQDEAPVCVCVAEQLRLMGDEMNTLFMQRQVGLYDRTRSSCFSHGTPGCMCFGDSSSSSHPHCSSADTDEPDNPTHTHTHTHTGFWFNLLVQVKVLVLYFL